MTRVKRRQPPPMHPNEALVRRFYACFAARDAEGMAGCYHPEVFFSDPAFPRLRGAAAGDMWRMLLSRSRDLEVTLEEASGGADGVVARWTARYTFRGRPVVNRVRSMFAFREGRIVRHYDHFSFWRWAAQGFGPWGAALGWFGPFRWAVRQRAARALERFSESRS